MITVSIIAIMASMLLFALYNAQESAKASRTRALIVKLDAIIKAKWDSYQTRRVPVVIPPGTNPAVAAKMRLDALRDLMRMELPDRWNDVTDDPAVFNYPGPIGPVSITRPAVNQGYLRRYNSAPSAPTGEFAGAECLYMIVMAALQEEGDSREVFKADNIGDMDNRGAGDGFPEFIDGWGRPIKFLRWAPGFQDSELQIVARVPVTGTVPTLTVNGPAISKINPTTGSYVGGAVIELTAATGSQPVMFNTANAARIIGYNVASGTATITLPSGGPSVAGDVVITSPDPFDPVGANLPPAGATPSFALYPLIYSAGPDKCYSIMADTGGGIHYADATNLDNPFITITEAISPPVTGLIGTARNDPAEENYVANGWRDNIHNHLIGLK